MLWSPPLHWNHFSKSPALSTLPNPLSSCSASQQYVTQLSTSFLKHVHLVPWRIHSPNFSPYTTAFQSSLLALPLLPYLYYVEVSQGSVLHNLLDTPWSYIFYLYTKRLQPLLSPDLETLIINCLIKISIWMSQTLRKANQFLISLSQQTFSSPGVPLHAIHTAFTCLFSNLSLYHLSNPPLS